MKCITTFTCKQPVDIKRLTTIVIIRLLGVIIVFGIIFFLPAGTFDYWEAIVFMAILIIPATGVMIYLLRNDPELLERRMKTKEKEKEQQAIMKFGIGFFLFAFLIPGFDRRFDWSVVPIELVIISDALVLTGYVLFIRVIRENRFASRIIEIAEGQKVISTGPYAIIRHPMYAACLIIYLCSPLALGSYWAVLPGSMIIYILILRIRNEEKVLKKELNGYLEYTRSVKYRLVPGIW